MKLPSIKLPALKISLPKLGGGLFARFGKKKTDDEIDEDILDGLDVDALDKEAAADAAAARDKAPEDETDEDGAPPSPSPRRGLDDDEDLEDIDDDLDDMGDHGSRKRLFLIIGVAALLLVSVAGGAAWFLFSGDGAQVAVVEGAGTGESSDNNSGMIQRDAAVTTPPEGPEGVPRVIAALPPRGAAGLITPQEGAAPGAPAAGASLAGGIGTEDPNLGLIVAAVTPASYVGIPDVPSTEPLPTAPQQGLFENGDHGLLPRIGPDGKSSFQAYARPFSGAADLLRIAIVVKGLGLNRASTDAAIRKLPPEVTMAFSPYAEGIADWMRFARERGHETLIELPLEPREFPVLDPGPYGLRTLADPADNQRVLEFVLGRGAGYVGVLATMGSKYNQNREQLSATLSHLKARGLMFVDGTSGEGSLGPSLAGGMALPHAFVNTNLDRVSSRAAVATILDGVVDTARKKSVAVLTVDPTPVVIEALSAWIRQLEGKGLVLAPVSALADKQLF